MWERLPLELRSWFSSRILLTISSVRFTKTAGIQDVRQVLPTEAGMSAVPEPATWAFMIVGSGAVGSLMRRRRTGYRTAQAV